MTHQVTQIAQRPLGRSGMMVSEICLGAMMFGDQTEAAEAARIVGDAAERGINFIDTADVYAGGQSEVMTGSLIRAQRDRWILATKVGAPMRGAATEPGSGGLSRRWVTMACDRSLKRLATDRIDLYYVHKTDDRVPWSDTVATFGDLIRAGKIRGWGLSNVRAWHIPEIVHQCRSQNVPQPVALQPYYNLMNRQPEVELLPAAAEYGLGVATYSPLARGILTGKYRAGEAPAADTRAGRQDRRMVETEWRPESLDIAQRLAQHASGRGASLIDFALAWVLNNRAVSAVIAGPRTFEQWLGYVAVPRYAWSAADEQLVDRLVTPGHPSTPGYNDPSYPLTGRYPTINAG